MSASHEPQARPVTCPVCDHAFVAFAPRQGSAEIVRHDTDFMPHFLGVNLLHHSVCVCPECGFAALNEDWGPVESSVKLNWIVGELSGGDHRRFDFTQPERSAYAALLSCQLALRAYQARGASAFRLGEMHQRLAWLFRQGHDVRRENQALVRASTCFEQAFLEHESTGPGANPERTAYLVGELQRRLGHLDAATNWFQKAIALDSPLGETARWSRQQILVVDEIRRYEAMLADVEILRPLTLEERMLLATLAEPGRLTGSRVVCEQDAPGTSMFVVVTGDARVEVDGRAIATLGPGQVFGEMSLFTGRRRSATVRSEGLLEVLEISRPAFKAILQANPDTADGIGHLVANRQAESSAIRDLVESSVPEGDVVAHFRKVFELS